MYKSVGFSSKGGRSSENEDSYVVLANKSFFLVADGVGGGPNGRDASKIIVEEIIRHAREDFSPGMVREYICSANTQIKMNGGDLGVKGMASTVAALLIQQDVAHVFNVGDSRVYRLTGLSIEQLTVDHSKVVDSEKRSKNIITNAVGVRSILEIEVSTIQIRSGDAFLLMSDGISDVLADKEIHEIVNRSGLSLFERCLALVSESEVKGGRDDKTVILVASS